MSRELPSIDPMSTIGLSSFSRTERNVSTGEMSHLPKELAVATTEIVEYYAENYGFLPLDHEITTTIQGWADTIRSPNSPSTRVLIMMDKQVNAFATADGTIIYTAGLVNRLINKDKLSLLPYALLHEVPHFERGHTKKTWKYWYADASATGIMKNHLSHIGMKRWHEYEADMTALFKAEKLGIPAIEYSALLRILGEEDADDENEDWEMDIVHGNLYDRELNVALAHTVVEFSSSSEDPPAVILHDNRPIDVPDSRRRTLIQAKSESELIEKFEERSPLFRTVFLQEEFSTLRHTFYDNFRSAKEKYNTKKMKEAQESLEIIVGRINTLFTHIEGKIQEKLSFTSPDSLRHAMQCIITQSGDKGFDTVWETMRRIKESIPDLEIPASFEDKLRLTEDDLSLPAYQDYLTWFHHPKLYTYAGLNTPERNHNTYPSFLWFVGGIPEIVSEQVLNFSNRTIEQTLVEMHTISRFMEDQKYFTKNDSWRWTWYGGERIIARYLSVERNSGKNEQYLIAEAVRLLDHIDQVTGFYLPHYTYGQFADAILATPKYQSDPRKNEIEYEISILREPVSETLLSILKAKDTERILHLMNSNTTVFLQELGRATKTGDYEEDDWNFIKTTIIESWDSLTLTYPIGYSDFRDGERMRTYWVELLGKTNYQLLLNNEERSPTRDAFSRLRFLFETGYMYIAEGNFRDKDEVLSTLLADEHVQHILSELSFFQLDHIIRSYLRETVNVNIDCLETTWSKYDLELHYDYNYHRFNDFDMGDRVMSILPMDVYIKKLYDYVQPKTVEEVTKYHTFLVHMVIVYGYNGYDLGEKASITTEIAARLLEHSATLFYQKVYEEIGAATNWERQVNVYYSLKKIFPFRHDDRRILSFLQREIITNPDAPLARVLDVIEYEAHHGFLTIDTLRSFVQLRVRSYEEYQNISDKLLQILDGFTSTRARDLGLTALGEQFFEYYSTPHGMFRIFEAMMESGKDDTKLRELLAPWYWHVMIRKENLGTSRERGYDLALDENGTPYINGASLHNFITFNEVVDYLYDMPELGKIILFRKLFLSRNGLLVNKSYAEEMSNIFSDALEQDKLLTPKIKAIAEAALTAGDPIYMFLVMSQAFMPQFLQKPSKKGNMMNVASKVSTGDSDWRDFGNIRLTQTQILHVLSFEPLHKKENTSTPAAQRIIGEYTKVIDLLNNQFGHSFPKKNSKPTNKPIQVIKKGAEATAPIGTGVAQISSQFVPILNGPYAELIDVYDNNEGQTFFSALYMMEKIAMRNPEMEDFLLNNFIALEEEIGSGKVATTIRSRIIGPDGTPLLAAIKVLNPNALTWTRIMNQEFRAILAHVEETKSLPTRDIEITKKALDIVEEWIEEEIVDPFYVHFDDIVRSLHENQPTSTRFTLRFPKRLGPQLDQIKVDEYIDGENIGRYLRNDAHTPEEKKDAVRAMAELIIRTLNVPTPDGTYVILKDISQGNARVTSDALYSLDRQYRQISEHDRNFIHTFLHAGFTARTIDHLVEYLGSLPQNAHVSAKMKTTVATKLKGRYISRQVRTLFGKKNGDEQTGFIDTVNLVLKSLDEETITVPNYFRLFVVKTLVSMNTLFEEANMDIDFQTYYQRMTR